MASAKVGSAVVELDEACSLGNAIEMPARDRRDLQSDTADPNEGRFSDCTIDPFEIANCPQTS
jgi:hypothetical protein